MIDFDRGDGKMNKADAMENLCISTKMKVVFQTNGKREILCGLGWQEDRCVYVMAGMPGAGERCAGCEV